MMRSHVVYTLLAALFLVADVRRSFVDPAPVDNERGETKVNAGSAKLSDGFDEVKQLEDLKHSFGKTFSMLKTHSSVFSDVNGEKQGHSETRQEVNQDGKLLSRVDQKVDSRQEPGEGATPATQVRTEVEVPSQGIHRTMLSDSQQDVASVERRNNNVDKYTAYSGVQYSPLDMAEYVFWTGDEKGVTLAIEEFLQEGLMTREEAIAFLQEIKINLDFLQNHYTQLRQHNTKEEQQLQAKERANMIQKALGLDKTRMNEAKMNSVVDNDSARELLALAKKNSAVEESNGKMSPDVADRAQQVLDEDYEELLERLKVADFLYTEYSLEEVIYQLAKVMFSQSLNRGSAEAQEALQKFTSFLEAEAEQGHISRSLEKKVLDVLIASLSDTLSEHPQLLSVAREGLLEGSSGNQLLNQLLLLNPAASSEAVSSGSEPKSGSNKSQGTDSHLSTKGRENETAPKPVNSGVGKSSKTT